MVYIELTMTTITPNDQVNTNISNHYDIEFLINLSNLNDDSFIINVRNDLQYNPLTSFNCKNNPG